MTNSEEKYFALLKREIVAKMQETYPGIPESVSDWKGQNIIDFQSDLKFKLNHYLSEKWFYNHMKSESSKLPRIDILNFLSEYTGFQNWDNFKHVHSNIERTQKSNKSKKQFYTIPLITVVGLTIIYSLYVFFYSQEYRFCFYDSITRQPVQNTIIEVTLLEKKQSPRNYLGDTNGCFTLKTNKRKVSFVVESPYYKRDTISRTLSSFNRNENIKLRVDDYALLLHYFSNNKIQDWMNRRQELSRMFSDEAKIYQVYEGTVGMEMYNKWEFIQKLSLPSSGLKDIEILNTKYDDEQITHLRFRQNGNSE
ncbi:hypothetical protein [Maribellus mangrovi]|uniref:hypothetical protein n=1 Tax=Maribellus mangrovi TaxID=3133146 RepID=UPI0030ED0866